MNYKGIIDIIMNCLKPGLGIKRQKKICLHCESLVKRKIKLKIIKLTKFVSDVI